jgi:hypothetical protein
VCEREREREREGVESLYSVRKRACALTESGYCVTEEYRLMLYEKSSCCKRREE